MLKILAIANLLLAPLVAVADTADDYFHRGAQHYVFGDKPKATNEVVTGLRQFPTDAKLNELASLLKKEEEQQKQEQQQQKNDQQTQDEKKQQQQAKDDQKKQADKQDQQSKNEPQKQEEKKDGGESQPKEGGKDDQKAQAKNQGGNSDDKEKSEGSAARVALGQMTPEQAMQVLEAHKGEERTLLFKLPGSTNSQGRVFKNW